MSESSRLFRKKKKEFEGQKGNYKGKFKNTNKINDIEDFLRMNAEDNKKK